MNQVSALIQASRMSFALLEDALLSTHAFVFAQLCFSSMRELTTTRKQAGKLILQLLTYMFCLREPSIACLMTTSQSQTQPARSLRDKHGGTLIHMLL